MTAIVLAILALILSVWAICKAHWNEDKIAGVIRWVKQHEELLADMNGRYNRLILKRAKKDLRNLSRAILPAVTETRAERTLTPEDAEVLTAGEPVDPDAEIEPTGIAIAGKE